MDVRVYVLLERLTGTDFHNSSEVIVFCVPWSGVALISGAVFLRYTFFFVNFKLFLLIFFVSFAQ